MGTRRGRQRQEELWVATATLAQPASHPSYEGLNQILDECGFDEFVEKICQPFYAERLGRPSMMPGMYFRLLMVGYFEGIDSERGIAWRAADSLGIRAFLQVGLNETVPDQTTISRTRRLIDVETHQTVFAWVLSVLAENGLLRGKTIGIDATTLEANAALRSIVRRDSGESYDEFLRRLAKESGIETPTRAQLARLDRKRAKKGSNEEWTHPHDPDARITKMKDGRHPLSAQGRARCRYGNGSGGGGHRTARPCGRYPYGAGNASASNRARGDRRASRQRVYPGGNGGAEAGRSSGR